MPKINAATVAEHRAHQRAALLAAARDLLINGGYAALTFAALAVRTGLARPTVYSYFRSKDDVVIALSEVELPLVGTATSRAMAQARTRRDRLAAFVRAQLQSAQQGRFRLAHALINAPLSASTRARIIELHHEFMPSPVPLLAELGHPHPELAANLLQGVINTAAAALEAGESPTRVTRVTIDAVLDGLGRRLS